MTSSLKNSFTDSITALAAPTLHSVGATEQKEIKASSNDEFLTKAAFSRRDKVQAHLSILKPNPDIDERLSGFVPPLLSISVNDLEKYMTECLSSGGFCSSPPDIVGGAAGYILGELPYCDVDLCYELKYVSMESLKDIIANFILDVMMKSPLLDLHAFIFKLALPTIKSKTKAPLSTILIKHLEESLKSYNSSLDFSSYLPSPFTDHSIEEAVKAIKAREGFDLNPGILSFLKKEEFGDRESSRTMTIQNLLHDYVTCRYLYIQRTICHDLVFDLGSIDIKFASKRMDPKDSYRPYVALHDSLRVPFLGDKICCASPCFQEAWKALQEHLFIVPSPEKVSDLAFRTALAMRMGLKISPMDPVVKEAAKQLQNSFPTHTISKEHDRDLAMRYSRHQRGHYSDNGHGAVFGFLNFVQFLLENFGKPVWEVYFEKIAKGCISSDPTFQSVGKLAIHLQFLNKQYPGILPQLMSLIRGAFLLAWVRKDSRIGAYCFKHTNDQGNVYERYSMHFSFKHDASCEYLAIPELLPQKLAEDFLSAWIHVEHCVQKLMPTKTAEITELFRFLGFSEFEFSPSAKKNILRDLIQAFENPAIHEITQLMHPKIPLCTTSFYEFIATHLSECVDLSFLHSKLLHTRLWRMSAELAMRKEKLSKALLDSLEKHLFQTEFQPNSAHIREITRQIVSLAKPEERQKIDADPYLKALLAHTLQLFLITLARKALALPNGLPNMIFAAAKCGIFSPHEKNICMGIYLEATHPELFAAHLPTEKITKLLDAADPLKIPSKSYEVASLEISKALICTSEVMAKRISHPGEDVLIYKCLLAVTTSVHAQDYIPKIQELFAVCLEYTLQNNSAAALRLAGTLAHEFLNFQKSLPFPACDKLLILLASKLLQLESEQIEEERFVEQYHQLGIQLFLEYGNAFPDMPQQGIHPILVKRIALAFKLDFKNLPDFYAQCIKELAALNSFNKAYGKHLKSLEELVRDFDTKSLGAILAQFVQIISQIDPHLAEEINALPSTQRQLDPEILEASSLQIILNILASKKEVDHAYQLWERSQQSKCICLYCPQFSQLELRLVTAVTLLKHILLEKENNIRIEKINHFLISLIKENRDNLVTLNKENANKISGLLFETLVSIISPHPEATLVALAENLYDHAAPIMSALHLNQIALQLVHCKINHLERPDLKRIKAFLTTIFETTALIDLTASHQTSLVNIAFTLAERCLKWQTKWQEEAHFQLAVLGLKGVLESKCKFDHAREQFEQLCTKIIKNVPVTPFKTDGADFHDFMPLLIKRGHIARFSNENKAACLRALQQANQFELFKRLWEALQNESSLSKSLVDNLCPDMCHRGGNFLKLVYSFFVKQGGMERQNSLDLLHGIASGKEPECLTWLLEDNLIKKALHVEDEGLFWQCSFKYFSAVTKEPVLDKPRLGSLYASVKSEWEKLAHQSFKEWPIINSKYIEILLNENSLENFETASTLFLKGPCAEGQAIGLKIIRTMLTFPETLNERYHTLLFQVLQQINDCYPINPISRETAEIFETMQKTMTLSKTRSLCTVLFQIFQTCLNFQLESDQKAKTSTHRTWIAKPTLAHIQKIFLELASELIAENESHVHRLEKISQTYLDEAGLVKYNKIVKEMLAKHLALAFLAVGKPTKETSTPAIRACFAKAKNPVEPKEGYPHFAVACWEATAEMLPIRIVHDSASCEKLAELAVEGLNKSSVLAASIHQLVTIGDKRNWCQLSPPQIKLEARIVQNLTTTRIQLQFQLISAFCKEMSLDAIQKQAPHIMQRIKELEKMASSSDGRNYATLLSSEVEMVLALTEWRYPHCLLLILKKLLPAIRTVQLKGPDNFLRILPNLGLIKLHDKVAFQALCTPNFVNSEEYSLYMEFIKYFTHTTSHTRMLVPQISLVQDLITNFLSKAHAHTIILQAAVNIINSRDAPPSNDMPAEFLSFTNCMDLAVLEVYDYVKGIMLRNSTCPPERLKEIIHESLLAFATLEKEQQAFALSKEGLKNVFAIASNIVAQASQSPLFNCPYTYKNAFEVISTLFGSLTFRSSVIPASLMNQFAADIEASQLEWLKKYSLCLHENPSAETITCLEKKS